MKKRVIRVLALTLTVLLIAGAGTAAYALDPYSVSIEYRLDYYPYPIVTDYTLPSTVMLFPGQTIYYSQFASGGYYIRGVYTGSVPSVTYGDGVTNMKILVWPKERPVATVSPYVTTTPGAYGYGYYYGNGVNSASYRLVIGPDTFKAVRGKTYTFRNSRLGGAVVDASGLTWTSSNSSVVSVTKPGVVRTRKAGTATITAMAQDGITGASVVFTVK